MRDFRERVESINCILSRMLQGEDHGVTLTGLKAELEKIKRQMAGEEEEGLDIFEWDGKIDQELAQYYYVYSKLWGVQK